MTIKLGILMDPIGEVQYKKDSSLAMLWAAQDKGWTVFYMEQNDLYIEQGRAMARMRPMKVYRDPDHIYDLGSSITAPLADMDVVLMRKDPPFDQQYIYSTYILELAEQEGALIVNKPQSLRDCNEKVFSTHFSQFTPDHLVSAADSLLREFVSRHKDVIMKPLDGMGGTSIFRVRDKDANLGVIIETLTELGKTPIMAQKYIPEISAGDKRILVVNGVPVPYCLARIPSEGETRGNLAAGGTGVAQPLSARDREIADYIAPILKQKGILFAGLDVIGDYLTEVNVTSPTCIREIDNAYNTNIGMDLMIAIENILGKK